MRRRQWLWLGGISILCATFTTGVVADEPRTPKVLIIGIDGCRADVFPACLAATHLPQLIRDGAFSGQMDVLGDRETGAFTITGPGWSSILTGVWADKHGVKMNDFKTPNFKEYPTFFKRLIEKRPQAKTVALVSWLPFKQYVFSAEEDCRLVADGDKVGYESADRAVAEQAVKVLAEENPDAAFVYFGDVDINGHGYGFHPRSPRYTASVERVDGYIGKILEALRSRPSFDREDWLIMVCTDHGGKGTDHGDGQNEPEIRNGFLIQYGPSVKPGKIAGRHFNADIAATALQHLGIAIDPAWKFDGKPLER